MQIRWIFVVSILIESIIYAQPAWTQSPGGPSVNASVLSMTQAVAIALEKHPVIESAQHALRAGEARTEQARAPYYPQVGASAIETSGALRSNAFLRPSGSLIQPNQTDFTAGLTATQLLYDFGQTAHKVKASRFAAQALSDDVLTQKANVVLNVQRAYYEGLKRRRLVQIAEETVREREVIKHQVDSLYRQQLKAKLDLDLVQVELSNAAVDLIRAKNDLKASYAALNNAMGVTGSSEYTLEDPLETIAETQSLDSLLATAVDKRPEMLATRERIRSAEQRIKAANSQNYPTIEAVGGAGGTDQLAGRPNSREGGWWSAGIALTIPVFTGFLVQNQVQEASEQYQEALSAARNIEQEVRLEIINAFLNAQTLAEQTKAIAELVRQTKEALQLAQQRYRLGLNSIVEVTQGEVAVTTAETKLADAQYDYKAAEAMLAYAVGEGYPGI